MIFKVETFSDVNKTLKMTRIITVSTPVKGAADMSLEDLDDLEMQPRYIANHFLVQDVSTPQGIQKQQIPFNFPINATTLEEAFEKFDEAGKEHFNKTHGKKIIAMPGMVAPPRQLPPNGRR